MDKVIDKYYTIKAPKRAEIKIKGSKFIASALKTDSKEEAEAAIGTIRSEFHDATHNCFAFRIGHSGLIFRYSDDGEPNGSAGKPILFAIKKFGYSDVTVVVTRYYGGTKLGVGGLARAYGDAAEAALELCEKKVIHRTTPIKVFCTYEDISPVKRIIDDMAVSFEEEYTDSVEFLVNLHLSKVDEFEKRIINATNARAGLQKK